MKKKILTSLLVLVLSVSCVGCGPTYQEVTGQVESNNKSFADGYFTIITEWGNNCYYIVYANDTKVKYFVKWSSHNFDITPLFNADGTLQIYEGE